MSPDPSEIERSNPKPGAPTRRRHLLILLYAFLAYTTLAVALTFPLVQNLSSRLPYDLGDPLLVTSILWWNAHVTPLTEHWWNGFGFFPANGMMAFSEHFLGAALIASPLQWLGLNAVTAYNVTFLASFPLCAIAAYVLALTLTRRHDAAFVCGLAYGFNPSRVAHIEHLELLLGFGMPAALAALHLYVNTRRVKWLVPFSAALVIQVLSGSYYSLFFVVLLGLWILWFMRPFTLGQMLPVAAAGLPAALVMSPIVFGYMRIHDGYDLTRDFSEEILRWSADVSSFVTASPLSALWGWTAPLNGGERQLFPGLTITILAVLGVVAARRSPAVADRLTMVSKICWGVAMLFLAIAIGAYVGGPWHLEWGWLRVSVTVPYKPLSLASAFAVLAIAFSTNMRVAVRTRSVMVFYIVAAVVLILCSLGPKPTLLGEQILYEPPYAWLMRLPFFSDTVRVPARFGMLAALALSVVSALAFHRLAPAARRRGVLLVVVAGLVADGWIRELPLPSVPERSYRLPPQYRSAAVLELPLGDVWRDTAALYRATFHHARIVNGYNGYEPSYYQVLRRALAFRNARIFEALASYGPIVVAVDKHLDSNGSWVSYLSAYPKVVRLSEDANWALFKIPRSETSLRRDPCADRPVIITDAWDARGRLDARVFTDQNPVTRWITSHDQRPGDMLILDLGKVQPVCGVKLSMGSAAALYPGNLSVATSIDNKQWESGFVGTVGGRTFIGALENPSDTQILLPINGQTARFVRLRIEETRPRYPWAVSDIVIHAQR